MHRPLELAVGQHGDVIDRGVRPGVARPQLRGQDFVGLRDDRQQRVMPVAAFVVRAGVLLVGFGVDQRRVEVDDQIVTGRTRSRRPRPLTRCRPRRGDAAELDRADLIEGAPHRRLRRDRPEHRPLRTHRRQVGQTRRAISERQHHLRERATRVVTTLRQPPPSPCSTRRSNPPESAVSASHAIPA